MSSLEKTSLLTSKVPPPCPVWTTAKLGASATLKTLNSAMRRLSFLPSPTPMQVKGEARLCLPLFSPSARAAVLRGLLIGRLCTSLASTREQSCLREQGRCTCGR
eukprot:1492690-Pleurochrysis_carterae.AAC.1